MVIITNTDGSPTEGLVGKGVSIIDTLFSQEKQSEWLKRLKAFAASRPKLTAFLVVNIALSGGPLLLFISFTITALVFFLITALLMSVIAALLFIVFVLLVVLLVVLPAVFLSTLAATLVFLWGLGGFFVISWLSRTGRLGGEGEAVGDKLNNFSGGRLEWLMSDSRENPQDGVEKDSKDEKDSLIAIRRNGLSDEMVPEAGHSANGNSEQSKETVYPGGPDSNVVT